MASEIKYRPDIDGLRALAVLPVVFFHAGFEFFSGGFVGVDVFFVISGFLITSILYSEISGGRFSLVQFYERRVRRIMPALLVVLAFTLFTGYFLLLPEEFSYLGESTLATLLFIANIFFWSETGYFAIEAKSTPLLHMWSLGVEEQFYLFFPLLLAFVHRFRAKLNLVVVLWLGFFISLALSVFLVYLKPSFTFYNLPTRAWELLAGSLLAIHLANKQSEVRSKHANNIIGSVGLALIIGTVLLLDEKQVFPGALAVPPVLGACLIIYAGASQKQWVGQLLSSSPLVWVGLISYSLYLWHWPITVFIEFLIDEAWTPYLIVTVSILFAWGSYIFVETPFRQRRIGKDRAALFITTLGFTSPVIVAAIIIIHHAGLSNRLPEVVVKIADGNTYLHSERHCHFLSLEQIENGDACLFGQADKAPTFALLGDSHADALRPALETAALNLGISGLHMTRPGCRPLLGVKETGSAECVVVTEKFLNQIIKTKSVETIFLAGFWELPFTGFSYKNNNNFIVDETNSEFDVRNNPTVYLRGLGKTIDLLIKNGKKVVFVEDVPHPRINVKNYLARKVLFGLTPSKLYFEQNLEPQYLVKNAMGELLDQVDYLELATTLCDGQYCKYYDNGLLYRDGDHLSVEGSKLVAPVFESVLRPH